jgi:hypothetical protein
LFARILPQNLNSQVQTNVARSKCLTSSGANSDYFVSFYNYAPEVREQFQSNLPRSVKFHDITLRDGEQQANIIFRGEEKIKIAKKLDEAGVDRIEAGFPSVSKRDFEAIKEIAHLGLSSKVVAFARCLKSDVDAALRCDVDGIMMEVPSSDHLIKYGYGLDGRPRSFERR